MQTWKKIASSDGIAALNVILLKCTSDWGEGGGELWAWDSAFVTNSQMMPLDGDHRSI